MPRLHRFRSHSTRVALARAFLAHSPKLRLLGSGLGPGAWRRLLELEDLQPSLAIRSRPNTRYPWTRGLSFEPVVPAEFFTAEDADRALAIAKRVLAVVRRGIR